MIVRTLKFLTNNKASWSTHFKCFICPCIHYTVVNKGRTGVWDACTVHPYSCFFQCFLCLWTSLHFLHCLARLNTSITISQYLHTKHTYYIHVLMNWLWGWWQVYGFAEGHSSHWGKPYTCYRPNYQFISTCILLYQTTQKYSS